MAAPMDILDSEGGKGKTSGSALSVSKSSSKINKNLRRTVTQPRPAPTVYKTEPGEFRSLVQQLTGTSPPAEQVTILTPKPSNPRLQKHAQALPPLRPVFSYPSIQQQQQQQTQSTFNPGPMRVNSMPSMQPFNNQITPQTARPSNFAISPLSFSPLPALSPSDHIWANAINPLESPGSAAMRHLAQSMAEGDGTTGTGIGTGEVKREGSNNGHAAAAIPPAQNIINAQNNSNNFSLEFSRFAAGGPMSPRFSPSGFNLPSPGMMQQGGYGFGNMYGFSSQFSPTAALAMDTSFTFPEPDISSSAYS